MRTIFMVAPVALVACSSPDAADVGHDSGRCADGLTAITVTRRSEAQPVCYVFDTYCSIYCKSDADCVDAFGTGFTCAPNCGGEGYCAKPNLAFQ